MNDTDKTAITASLAAIAEKAAKAINCMEAIEVSMRILAPVLKDGGLDEVTSFYKTLLFVCGCRRRELEYFRKDFISLCYHVMNIFDNGKNASDVGEESCLYLFNVWSQDDSTTGSGSGKEKE